MIAHKNSFYHLFGHSTSLILQVNEVGKLICIHYGRKLPEEESYDSLSRLPQYGPGTAIVYDEKKNPSLCLDYLRLESSTALKGDFGVPSLILDNGESDLFDFVYESGEIVAPKKIDGLPTPRGADEELVIHLIDKAMDVRVDLHYLVYAACDVIGRYVTVLNDSSKPLTIRKASSLQLVLPDNDFELLTLYGAWAGEANQQRFRLPVGTYVSDSKTGDSSARHNPFFMLVNKKTTLSCGPAYAFNLVYSGSHEEAIERDDYGNVRLQSGISPFLFSKTLAQGESFSTPLAVMTYSDEGLNGTSHHFHDFVNDHVVPAGFSRRPRPVVYNNWEATMFSFNEMKLHALAKKAASLGAELFVLDDGWFGKRDDDKAGLGDWVVNKKKLPHGLDGLAFFVNKQGMRFGLWVEPEMVNEDSDLFRAHPDWVIREANHAPSKSRNQWTLNLTKKDVRDYLLESLSRIFLSAHIEYVKWDYNRHMSDVGTTGSFYHDYILGLYELLDRLTAKFPLILFENCSSGGNRNDLGMLSYFPQNWTSDDTDSFQRITIQSGYALAYPLSTLSNHVSAKTSNQMLRATSFGTKFDVACFGLLGYEFNVLDLNDLEEKEIKEQIAFYKSHREMLQYGPFDQISSFVDSPIASWEVHDDKKALISQYNSIQRPDPPQGFLKGVGFADEREYQYAVRREEISLKRFGSLVNMISPIHLKEDGLLMNIVSAHKTMPIENDEGVCSGAALNAGLVALCEQWRGTGYSENVRLLGDFGARIYEIGPRKLLS